MNINEIRFLAGVISEEAYYELTEETHPVQDKNVLANWMKTALDAVIGELSAAGPEARGAKGDLEHLDRFLKTMASQVEMGDGLDVRQADAIVKRIRQLTSPAAMMDPASSNQALKPHLNKLENVALELEKEIHKARGTWAS